jgi:hypothetical protein
VLEPGLGEQTRCGERRRRELSRVTFKERPASRRVGIRGCEQQWSIAARMAAAKAVERRRLGISRSAR